MCHLCAFCLIHYALNPETIYGQPRPFRLHTISRGATTRRNCVLPEARIEPLTGGVSSEIYRVEDGGKTFVVKGDWPNSRSVTIGTPMSAAIIPSNSICRMSPKFLPQAVPVILDSRPQHGYFSMEYLGSGFDNWKRVMLDGNCQINHAQMAGQIMGQIHRHSAGDKQAAKLLIPPPTFSNCVWIHIC